jgi:two-component system CheB/CheR fusion protein
MRTPEETWFHEFAAQSGSTLWLLQPLETVAYVSPMFEQMFGVPVAEVLADRGAWERVIHPADRAVALSAVPRAREGRPVEVDYRITRATDGASRWIRDKGFPLHGPDGNIVAVAGIARDVTEEKQMLLALAESEQTSRLLLAHLQHRVRNTLGVVRTLARQTGEQARDVQEFAMHLDGRLAAFARVQVLMTRYADAGASLREIVEEELLAHAAQEGDTVVVEGPDVLLEPRLAERLSLAVHELAVNAVKHGVLGHASGRLMVDWDVEPSRDGLVLGLAWKESGLGRALRKPRRTGFGTELLTRTLPYELKAKSAMHFGKNGFSYTLFVPLPQVDEGDRKSDEPRP